MIPNLVRIAKMAMDEQAQTAVDPRFCALATNDLPNELWTASALSITRTALTRCSRHECSNGAGL